MTKEKEPATFSDVAMVGIGILLIGEIGPADEWPVWYLMIPYLLEAVVKFLNAAAPVFWNWLKDPKP